MRSHQSRGFTLIELLVVIAVIAVLASIMFPVFAKAQQKARQTQCLSNVRQLTTAMLMFVQDNKNTYPDANTWATELSTYAGNKKLFTCPLDKNGPGYVSYAMNSLLVKADGTGVLSSQIANPVEVGMFVDAEPKTGLKFPDCGIVNGGNATNICAITQRHSACVSFVDGHAEALGGKKNFDINDYNSPIARAFYQGIGYGWVENNFGAGVTPPTASAGAVKPFGSSTLEDLARAAVDLWVAGGGAAENGVYAGSDTYTAAKEANGLGNIGCRSSYVASGADHTTVAVGRDAMVIVVNNNCKINFSGFNKNTVSSAKLLEIYRSGWDQGTNKVHPFIRTYNESAGVVSGTLEYFVKTALGLAFVKTEATDKATINAGVGVWDNAVQTNKDMVDAVANDPYAIGFCTAGLADPDKVTILKWDNGTNVQTFSRAAVLATVMTAGSGAADTAKDHWALSREIYMTHNPTPSAAVSDFIAFVKSPAFQNGPLMKSLYFPIN